MSKKQFKISLLIIIINFSYFNALGTVGALNSETLVVVWDNTFGGALDDGAYSIIETADKGFAFCGHTKSSGEGDVDFWLVKMDSSGKEQWQKTFGGIKLEFCLKILQTSDNGFLLAGHTESFGEGSQDFWLVRTDQNGNQLWNHTYGGIDKEIFRSAAITSDGGVIMTGGTWSFGSNQKIWLIKVNSSGTEEWNVTFGLSNTNNNRGLSVIQTSDNGFAISCGWRLIKTNSTGSLEVNATIGTMDKDYLNSIIQTNDGGFVFSGGTDLHDAAGSNDVYLLKTNSSGTIEWAHTYGGLLWDNAGYDGNVIQTTDDGFLIASQSFSFGSGNGDMWIIKTDSSGIQELNKTFGGPSQEDARSIILSSDGSIIIAGLTQSKGNGYSDAWVLKTSIESDINSSNSSSSDSSATSPGFELEPLVIGVSVLIYYTKSRKKM